MCNVSLWPETLTGSFVALGVTCENLALQAHAIGLEARIRSFPLERDTRLVASIDLVRGQAWPYWYAVSVQAIPSLQTNRKTGVRKPLPHGVLSRLGAAVQSVPGATLFFK